MTAHDPGDGPWPYFCVDAEHRAPWPCAQEWVFEPDLGAFKLFVCDDHGPVSMIAVVSMT
ncbi:MAG: hypothetical protein WDA07_02750 [Leucobacter sp.]